MIPISELRIGNNVLSGGTISVPAVVRILNVDESNEYDPILLTPDVLRLCGFALSRNSEHASINNIQITWARDSEGYNVKSAYVLNYIGFCCHGESRPVEYLHQLQNLMFAITGTELQYRP
jgi:hypothetical protein